MTWRSGICFNLFLTVAVSMPAASVSGSVEFVNTKPGKESRDLSGIAVWLLPAHGRTELPRRRATMLQKNKTFTPHVLIVPVGSLVDFPNEDPIFHNAFSNFNGKVFDVSLYPPGKTRSVLFDRPGIVRVFCNIHPSMSAVIVVVETPYYAVTDRTGHYSIDNMPAGNYKRFVFHERATPEVLASLESNMIVGDASTASPVIRISETGYIPMPHLNKYGKAYVKGSGEQSYGIPQ